MTFCLANSTVHNRESGRQGTWQRKEEEQDNVEAEERAEEKKKVKKWGKEEEIDGEYLWTRLTIYLKSKDV